MVSKKRLVKSWLSEIWEHKYLIALSLIFLLISIVLDYIAGRYVSRVNVVPVPDIILDNVPAVNLNILYSYGIVIILAILILYPLFHRIKQLSNVIAQLSFLIMTRSFFTCLTHLALPTSALAYSVPQVFMHFNFENDLFFSGHAAIPFLGFLMFEDKKIKYSFLIASIFMAMTVLLMHVHYTIDVFSAFFITYGTFKVGNVLFNKIESYFEK